MHFGVCSELALINFFVYFVCGADEKRRTLSVMEGCYRTERDKGGNGVIVTSREEFRSRATGRKVNDMAVTGNGKKKQKRKCLQELFTTDYIVNNVLRKDGPPLGQEFDHVPSGASLFCNGNGSYFILLDISSSLFFVVLVIESWYW